MRISVRTSLASIAFGLALLAPARASAQEAALDALVKKARWINVSMNHCAENCSGGLGAELGFEVGQGWISGADTRDSVVTFRTDSMIVRDSAGRFIEQRITYRDSVVETVVDPGWPLLWEIGVSWDRWGTPYLDSDKDALRGAELEDLPTISLYMSTRRPIGWLDASVYLGFRVAFAKLDNLRVDGWVAEPTDRQIGYLGGLSLGLRKFAPGFAIFGEAIRMNREFTDISWTNDGGTGPEPSSTIDLSDMAFMFGLVMTLPK